MPHFSRAVRVIGRRGSGILLPTNTTALSFTRNMSSDSSSPTKHLFAVYAPDCTDPGALDRRYSVREEHLKDIDRLHSSGIVKFGGALLAPELTDENDRKKITGSLAFYEAESIEEVRKLVESDIYYTSGVWDKENISILPFVPAMRWPSN
ncbi:hypothetical protein BJV77DRAFT_1015217 [Russula vinacea]|nr:hypothetical protein BJV77DRAFT_1015217 [Russula vinacea]